MGQSHITCNKGHHNIMMYIYGIHCIGKHNMSIMYYYYGLKVLISPVGGQHFAKPTRRIGT